MKDDVISRQAVLSLAKELKFGDYVTRQIDPYDVQTLPSAQPERKIGNWQDRRIIATNGNSLGIFRCSECKRASTITTAFCPNCGADMRGET